MEVCSDAECGSTSSFSSCCFLQELPDQIILLHLSQSPASSALTPTISMSSSTPSINLKSSSWPTAWQLHLQQPLFNISPRLTSKLNLQLLQPYPTHLQPNLFFFFLDRACVSKPYVIAGLTPVCRTLVSIHLTEACGDKQKLRDDVMLVHRLWATSSELNTHTHYMFYCNHKLLSSSKCSFSFLFIPPVTLLLSHLTAEILNK